MNSGRAVGATVVLAAAAMLAACDTVKTNLLEAVNPSIIDPVVGPIAGGCNRGPERSALALADRDGGRRKLLALRRIVGRRMGQQLDVRAER